LPESYPLVEAPTLPDSIDENLYECILIRVNPYSEEITEEHLLGLNKLSCYNAKIAKIGGIENLKNIEDLSLLWNGISDLRPLSELTTLRVLNLGDNLIEDIRPFAKELPTWWHSPFAFFIGLSATMKYHIKTDTLPLKIRLKKATQPFVGARTFEDINRVQGVRGNERGISI